MMRSSASRGVTVTHPTTTASRPLSPKRSSRFLAAASGTSGLGSFIAQSKTPERSRQLLDEILEVGLAHLLDLGAALRHRRILRVGPGNDDRPEVNLLHAADAGQRQGLQALLADRLQHKIGPGVVPLPHGHGAGLRDRKSTRLN